MTQTWLVRVRHNRVSVGIFSCQLEQLAGLVDEICDPSACEFKSLPPGGFIFGGEIDLHAVGDDNMPDGMDGVRMTSDWMDACYITDGSWETLDDPLLLVSAA